jgi:hypothetical protein
MNEVEREAKRKRLERERKAGLAFSQKIRDRLASEQDALWAQVSRGSSEARR